MISYTLDGDRFVSFDGTSNSDKFVSFGGNTASGRFVPSIFIGRDQDEDLIPDLVPQYDQFNLEDQLLAEDVDLEVPDIVSDPYSPIKYNEFGLLGQEPWTESTSVYTSYPTYTTSSTSATKAPNRSKVKGFEAFNKAYDNVESYIPDAHKYRTLLTEIAYQESTYRPKIVNRIGAAGYFQFIASTRKNILRQLGVSTDLNSFLNNPELQIVAAIQLAKEFEKSFSQEDLRLAAQKGHTMNGLISGAWLGGAGNVKKYLHRGKNASDGGTTILARIRLGDNLTQSFKTNMEENTDWAKSVNYNPTQIGDFNVTKAIDYLNYLTNFDLNYPNLSVQKNPNKSAHKCATAIQLTMAAGGLDVSGRPSEAGNYGPFLLKNGWVRLPNNTSFQKGDVCVTKGLGTKGYGHISMYNGQNWVSDFIQNSPLVYSKAKIGTNTFFYRYKG